MDFNRLPEHVANARKILFDEGHLMWHFSHLEFVEQEYHVEFFVDQAVDAFVELAPTVFSQLDLELERAPLDYRQLYMLVHRIRKRAHSVGANHVLTKMDVLVGLVVAGRDAQSLKNALLMVKNESEVFVSKIVPYMKMLRAEPPCEVDVDYEPADSSDEE